MKKLASALSAPFPWPFDGFARLSGLLTIALLVLPGGWIALALLWWLSRRKKQS